MKYTAPSGFYFFENGVRKSSLNISRELVELIGYGTGDGSQTGGTIFHGWIVLNRIDLMPNNTFGRKIKALAYGSFSVLNSVIQTPKLWTFDPSVASTISAQVIKAPTVGSSLFYYVYYDLKFTIPSGWNLVDDEYQVICTTTGYAVSATTVEAKSGYFIIRLNFGFSTGNTIPPLSGGFTFTIVNMKDFMQLI